MTKKKEETSNTKQISISVPVTIKDQGLWVHNELADGTDTKGIRYRLIEINSCFIVQHYDTKHSWTSYIIKKEDLFRQIVEEVVK